MKKVIFVIPSLRKTGVTHVLVNILKNIDRTKIIPSVISMNKIDSDNVISEGIKQLDIPIYYLNEKSTNLFIKIIRFRRILKKVQPNFVHFHSFKADLLYFFSRNFKTISTAHNINEEDFSFFYGKRTGAIMAMIQNYIFTKMNMVVSVSDSVHKYLMSKNILSETIYNGVDFELQKKEKLKVDISKLSRPIFISTGSPNKRKNLVQMLQAFRGNDIQGTLLLLGNGPLLKKYENEYSCKKIIFLGPVDNVRDYLDKADVFISTSKSEGLPLGALEAMSCNLPMLMSNIPQHIELNKLDSKFMVYYDINSMDDLLSKILLVQRIYMKTSDTFKTFENFYSSKLMGTKYTHLYLKMDNC